MKNFSIKYLLLVASFGFIFSSCDEDDYAAPVTEPVALTNGSADFSKFVAVGNSLTAGFTDGALFIAAQDNSIPNLLSQKFALSGGGEFTQPYMNDNIGGFSLGGSQFGNFGPRLYFDGAGPAVLPGTPTTDIASPIPGPYNNMGVPGAKSFHLLANGYGAANPYYGRMASSPTASVIEDVVAQNPTFFTLWIGANDVLSYATNGGSGVNQLGNTDPSTYGVNDITDPTAFAGTYNAILANMTANGSKGVVLNIPYVTSVPYFLTVPYNAIPLDAATANMLNQAFATYNGGLLQAESFNLITAAEREARTITFVEGQNAVTIEDEYLTDLSNLGLPSYRQATQEDLLILPSASFLGTTVGGNPQLINGVSVPLADNWVLSSDEVAEVITATDAFNASIMQLATQYDIPLIDVNAIMVQLSTGVIAFDDFNLNNSLVFGNTFSLDGIHPTARGYAFIANLIMQSIDAKYGSNFEASGNLLKANDFNNFYSPTLQ